MKFGMGQSVPRVEDPRLITGGGRYTDDHVAPNMARTYFLRSPHAHARIVSIDTKAALKRPGVLAIYTGADVAAAKLGNLPCIPVEMFPLKRMDGTPGFHPPRPPIARDRVRHVGDIVAMVVAETVNEAKDAAEAIEVEFEELPAVTEPAAAAAPGAPKVWDECPDNISFVQRIGDAAAVEVQLSSELKVEGRVVAADAERDIAVVTIDPGIAASIEPVPLGCAQPPQPTPHTRHRSGSRSEGWRGRPARGAPRS